MPKFGCFTSEHQALLFSSFARLMIKVIVLTGVAWVFITSIVWTTCKKPYSKGTSTYPRQSLDGSDDNPTMNPMSNWPVEKSEATKFTCPLLQRPGEWLDCGWVCEWTSKCREENLARDDEDYSPDAVGHDTGDDLENHLASRQALSLNKDLMSASPQGSNRNRRYGSPIYLVLGEQVNVSMRIGSRWQEILERSFYSIWWGPRWWWDDLHCRFDKSVCCPFPGAYGLKSYENSYGIPSWNCHKSPGPLLHGLHGLYCATC